MLRRRKVVYSGFGKTNSLRNWSFLILALAVIFFIWSGYFFIKSYGGSSSLNLSGIVFSDEKPVKDATIYIGEENVLTDEEGKFSLEGLSLGKKKVVVSKEGFNSYTKELFVWKKNQDLGKITLSKDEAHNIAFSGMVVSGFDGSPIGGAIINLGASNTTTDATGYFQFRGMSEGDFSMKITAIGFLDWEEKVSLGKAKSGEEYKLSPYGKLIFTSSRDGKKNIYSVNYDGSGLKNLTEKVRGDCWGGRMTSGGKTMIFYSNFEEKRDKWGYKISSLYAMNMENGATKKIDRYGVVPTGEDFIVTSDGNKVFFTANFSTEEDKKEIYMASLGKEDDWIQVTDNSYYERSFRVSPDGRYIAYSLYSDDGLKIIILDNTTRAEKTINIPSGMEDLIGFSPDSKDLLYKKEDYYGEGGIYVYDLTKNIEIEIYKIRNYISSITLSPKGDKLAFVSERDGVSNIYTVGVDGKNETKMTEKGGFFNRLLWPEIEKILVFEIRKESGNFLSVMNLSNRETKELELVSGDVISWSSEGFDNAGR